MARFSLNERHMRNAEKPEFRHHSPPTPLCKLKALLDQL